MTHKPSLKEDDTVDVTKIKIEKTSQVKMGQM